MKKLFFIVLSIFYAGTFFAQVPKYSRAKVQANAQQVRLIQSLGVDLDHYGYSSSDSFVGEFSEWEIQQMKAAGISLDILVDDLTAYYVQQNQGLKTASTTTTQTAPTGFNLGSMGGFLTYDEIVAELDSMTMMYPNLVTQKVSIGTTLEGRNIYMVKISDNANTNETEPEILYNAMHHCREPQGMMQLFYFFYYLLQNYGTDTEATYLINERELYFIPVVNPDGYVYNQTIAPNGGGMWRKNRKDNGDGSFGIDLNRNYGYQWGYNDFGSSPDPNSNLYRGTAPFSELETQAMRDLVLAHDFQIVLNYHTYGDLNLYPWGHKYEDTPDSSVFNSRGRVMKHHNHYITGPSPFVLYEVNGEANDWMYGEQIAKPKIFAMTTEIGKTGFWPTLNEIVPLSEENLKVNILNAWFAGEYAHCITNDTLVTATNTFQFPVICWNLGSQLLNNASVKITAVNAAQVGSISAPQTINNLAMGDHLVFNFNITLNNVNAGDKVPLKVEIVLSNGTIIPFDAAVYKGNYLTVFQDNFTATSANSWISNDWGVTSDAYNSPTYSFTDSPSNLYATNNTTTVLSPEINLQNIKFPYLQFYYSNSVSLGDYVSLNVIETGSGNTTNVRGSSAVSVQGEQGYAISDLAFKQEMVDLTAFEGKKIKLSFTLKAGDFQEDGFYLDDVLVRGIATNATFVAEDTPYQSYYLLPNPAKDELSLNVTPEFGEQLSLEIVSLQGQRLLMQDLKNEQIDVSNLVEGIYLYRYIGKKGAGTWRKLAIE